MNPIKTMNLSYPLLFLSLLQVDAFCTSKYDPDTADPEYPISFCFVIADQAITKLKTNLKLVKQYSSTYIPFRYEQPELGDGQLIPLPVYSYITENYKKYDALCIISDLTAKKYISVILNDSKLFLYEFSSEKGHISRSKIFSLKIEQKISEEIKNCTKKYKSLNKNANISGDDILNLFNQFTPYALGESHDTFAIYGVDSEIFGLVFGGIEEISLSPLNSLIPQNTPSYEMYSLYYHIASSFLFIKKERLEHAPPASEKELNDTISVFNNELEEEMKSMTFLKKQTAPSSDQEINKNVNSIKR